MPDIIGFFLLSPEVQSNLTDANKQFLNNVRHAAASVKEGETKKLQNKDHRATVKKQSGKGVVSIDIKPSGSSDQQKLALSARYAQEQTMTLDFLKNTNSGSETMAALDKDGDGNYDIGSFVYGYSSSHTGYKNIQGRQAVIRDADDNGKPDYMKLSSKEELNALHTDSIVVNKNYTSQEVFDTDGDGKLDKFGDRHTYDSNGQAVIQKSAAEIEKTLPSKELTPLEVLENVSGMPESSYEITGTPTKELMDAFIRNGGPVSWGKKK